MKYRILKLLIFFAPDTILALFLCIIYAYDLVMSDTAYIFGAGIVGVFVVRLIIYFFERNLYYKHRISVIKELLDEYKKGRFVAPKRAFEGNDELSIVFGDLLTLGKHLRSIITTQKNEIDKFHELYNSIVFSISTYYMILDEDETIVFANEGLCSKFDFEQNEIIGKKIDDIFYFVNKRLKEGIEQVKGSGSAVVLEKTHLLSVKKVSIIADIKISTIIAQEKKHEIVIIDDVTNKLQKDYQISLMSQISESIQKDVEIERVLNTILTGVTSGSGLGFNRAMLFLLDKKRQYLLGKTSVGPDSFEEAIEIWGSIAARGNILDQTEVSEKKSGKQLLESVTGARFSLEEDNIFTKCIKNKKFIHVLDLWGDAGISDEIKKFMDVKEFVIVPLVAVNKSIGIIVVDNKFNRAPISKDDIELLSIFSSQAAFSIESYVSLESVREEMAKISQRQEAIVESEKLAAIGRISAHIAHEIRNPLVTMGGYARRIYQLAREKDKGKENGGIKDSAKIILKESERLEKILSNVMDFTKPSRYIREFNNINDVIIDTVDLLKNLLQEKKITVDMNLLEDIPLVKCDFNQMKQVMLNLLQNSIDVIAPMGIVSISTESDGKDISIKVRDTGTGIDQDDPNIVFEPFFTTKVTGVGLGLAIVKKIIKDHGGDISVRNLPEGGSEFIITLPVPV